MLASKDPFVHQFIHAEPDGPVAFQYRAAPMRMIFDRAQTSYLFFW